MRIGIKNLAEILPDDEPVSRLVIYTDGTDMIVAEKGNYFSAITRQRYMCFDTEQISAELVILEKDNHDSRLAVEITNSGSPRRLHCR